MTSQFLTPEVQKATKTIEDGKRLKMIFSTRILPYALGYLLFDAIAQASSEERSIHVGLSEDSSSWLSEGRESLVKLEKPYLSS